MMDNAIFAIGNGEVMAYGRGGCWTEAVGPVYSAPKVFSMLYPEGAEEGFDAVRVDHSSVWRHAGKAGVMRDGASRGYRCLIRAFDLAEPVEFRLDFGKNLCVDNTGWFEGVAKAVQITVPAGTPVYNWYPSREHMWVQLLLRGGARLDGNILTLQGKGEMLLVGGGDYPELLEDARRAAAASSEAIFDDIDTEDARFTARRLARVPALKEHPLRKEALRAVDDAAMLIRAQQSRQGGVQAGHNYHLGYVRDQYGVFRGMMAMGMWEEAKAILGFYRDVFARFGKIANAQSMGNDGMFHVHEYDETEITGYLTLQAADMLRVTEDESFFRSLIPLLRWAMTAQMKLLHKGMLPFNGDETYIAGGILPRDCIACGALEATYLFAVGADRCLPVIARMEGEQDWMRKVREAVADVKAHYEENFRREGGYVCDSMLRLDGLAAPEVRHGVCMKCAAFGWNKRVGDNWYVCPKCFPGAADESHTKEYFLKSVVTMAVYTHCGMLDEAVLKDEVAAFLRAYRETGKLPSRPDGNKCLGYDYGLLLYAAAEYGMEADDLLDRMLSIRDSAGAWVEYYVDHKPSGTFCRPWESAINAEGALRALMA